jgi:hypothetical protein
MKYGTSSTDGDYHFLCNKEDLDFELVGSKEEIVSAKFPLLNGHRIISFEMEPEAIFVWLEDDYSIVKLFAIKALDDVSKRPEFIELNEKYKSLGWLSYDTPEIKEIYVQMRFRKQEENAENLRSEGSVLWFTAYWSNKEERSKYGPNDFKGGLSDGVFELLRRYIGDGKGVNGYVGHAGRTIETDQKLEREMRRLGLSDEKIAVWMTSTGGRHIMDDALDYKGEKRVLFLVRKIKSIYNEALIYSDPSHGGKLSDTLRIRNEYEAQGRMLSEI